MGRIETKRALLRLADAEESGETTARSGFVVAHQIGGRVVVLARVPTAVAHPAELDRFAVPLQAAGQTTGRVVLIEESTGRIVAQRTLSWRVRAWHRAATPNPHPRPALRRLSDTPSPPAPGAADRDRRGA